MTAVLANILWLLGGAAYGMSAYAAVKGRWHRCRLLAALGTALIAVECALERDWSDAAWETAVLAVILGADWWDRRGRKTAKQLGEKSRAVVAAIVAKAREAGTPLPEGAKA